MQTLTQTLAVATLRVGQSRDLCSLFPRLYAETRSLLAHSRRLCLTHRRIRGSSGDLDSPFLVEILAKTAMCVDCLQKQTGIPVGRIVDALSRVKRSITIADATARCGACLRITTVHRLSDGNGVGTANGHGTALNPVPLRPALVIQGEAIWRFLENRRGEMFCTQCIASVLSATKRIDRAILGVEGRGARRQYGPCATCGKERLLCGLAR